MAINHYIDNIELAELEGRQTRDIAVREADVTGAIAAHPLPEGLVAAVNASSVISFVDGVPNQQKEDVLFSTQFAIRAASAKFDRFAEPRAWYGIFVEVLETMGWAAEQFAWVQADQSSGEFHMDQAALAAITAIATGNQLGALKETLGALGKLADDNGAIAILDYQSSTDLAGNFQIGSVQHNEEGTLSMAFGGFFFRAIDKRRKFLFFKWGKKQVNFWSSAERMTFNVALYDGLREKVKKRLGDAATKVIDEIPLADLG